MVTRNTPVLYRGYGARGRVFVHGRALRRHRVLPAQAHHGRWRNLLSMLRRADADGIGHARVSVRAGTGTAEFTADDEGFFAGWVPVADARAADGDPDWIRLEATLPDIPGATAATGEAFHPRAAFDQLVISDIDDTVLQSRVTNFLRAAQTLAFGNARTRLPFPGVAAFYEALRVGASGRADNPLFYVSSSPWNLYDVITEFLEIQGVPKGPVMLRDLDIHLGALRGRHHHDHKGEHIRRILETYPGRPVILIGDSGQQDPEIYHRVVHDFPGRVSAIYIRNVTMNDDRSAAIGRLADEVLATGSSLLLADDTLAAARHAVEKGFIRESALPDIGQEKRADEGAAPGKADAPGTRDTSDAPTPTEIVEKP